VGNTLHRHMSLTSDKISFEMRASIVEGIIGSMFFREEEGVTDSGSDSDGEMSDTAGRKAGKRGLDNRSTLQLFARKEDEPDWYTVVINNATRFELAMDLVSHGLSFRQTAAAMQAVRDRMKNATLTGMNRILVSQYTRVLVGSCLQDIADLMEYQSVWALSIAFDSTTHFEQSYMDMRVRMCVDGSLCNLHLFCLPLFDRHTSENLFQVICNFLDALYPNWRTKLFNVSTDGENTMTGRHAGVVLRLTQCAEFPVLRVWCAPHQMDLVAKSSAEGIDDGAYVKEVYSYSVHLRSQLTLITEMGVKCPKKTTRWMHLGRVLNFFKENRRKIIAYTEQKHPDKLPSDRWWVITYAIAPAIDEINVTFTLLQNRSLLLAQQAEYIEALIAKLSDMFDLQVEDMDEGDDSNDAASMLIRAHIRDQGTAAQTFFDRMPDFEQEAVVVEIASYAKALLRGLKGVRAQRDESNLPLHVDVPPVMPQVLATMRPGQFIEGVLNRYRNRLAKSWPDEDIEAVEEDQRSLVKLYKEDTAIRDALDKHRVDTMFNDAWDSVPRFRMLRSFCGGIATVFPNTTSVESDFSILKWELDAFRTALMHMSLEGIMQSKQRALLRQLWA